MPADAGEDERAMSVTNLALSNLRAIVILIVVAFHSMNAYLGWLPSEPVRFDAAPYEWQAFPIIDKERFVGFDLFCAWNDVCLMSLMFFLSGLFVWPSLNRKGPWKYLTDRLLRIGVPILPAVFVLMPIALYPVYLVSVSLTPDGDPSIAAYWRAFSALPFWPCGPQWFLWQLLLLNMLIALVHQIDPRWGERLGTLAAGSREHPFRFIGILVGASALAYVPVALAFSPWTWLELGPFAFQWCRPLHYAVYFLAGAALGAHGLERGLLAPDGVLVRHWPRAVLAAILGLVLWMTPTAILVESGNDGPLWLQFAANIGFVVCCASGCLAMMGVCLRFATARRRWLDLLSTNAYGMYLVHYPFVVWMQYALLNAPLPAIAKVTIVFSVCVVLSLAMVLALRGIPFGGLLVGAEAAPAARSR